MKKLLIIIFACLLLTACSTNRLIVVNLTADPAVIDCSQQSFLKCQSNYVDVSYAWYSTGGQILYSQGDSAVFTAFQEGKYVITCRACDEHGNCAEDSVNIKVNYSKECK